MDSVEIRFIHHPDPLPARITLSGIKTVSVPLVLTQVSKHLKSNLLSVLLIMFI